MTATTRSMCTCARRVYYAVSYITKEKERKKDFAVMLELLNSFNKSFFD